MSFLVNLPFTRVYPNIEKMGGRANEVREFRGNKWMLVKNHSLNTISDKFVVFPRLVNSDEELVVDLPTANSFKILGSNQTGKVVPKNYYFWVQTHGLVKLISDGAVNPAAGTFGCYASGGTDGWVGDSPSGNADKAIGHFILDPAGGISGGAGAEMWVLMVGGC